MNDPTLVVLLGPRATRLVEKIQRMALGSDQANSGGLRIVQVVPNLPTEFLQNTRAADIYYALTTSYTTTDKAENTDKSLGESLDEIALAVDELLTKYTNDGGISQLLVTLVGYAECQVTLALWKALAEGIRERLLRRLAGLPTTITINYSGIVALPVQAEDDATRWRDGERYAWLREAYSCDWFYNIFFLSRASTDLTGASRPVLSENDVDDLIAASIYTLATTGLINSMPLPLLRISDGRFSSSLGLCYLDLPIARIRSGAARTSAADLITELLSRQRRVLKEEAERAFAQEKLDGSGLLERLLATTRPSDNLITQLQLPALEYNRIQELGEIPDRLRSYSTWLGQQRVVQLAAQVDANAIITRSDLQEKLYLLTATRADNGANTSPDYGRNFLIESWDLSAEMKRRVDDTTDLSTLSRVFGDDDLALQTAVEAADESALDACYQGLADALRNRVMPLAVFLRYGILSSVTAILAFVRLRIQFGTVPASLVALLLFISALIPAILTCMQSQQRIRRSRDRYMDTIVAYHRGTFFRYIIESLRTIIERLQEVIGDPTNYRNNDKYAQSERRSLEDAATALELRGKAFRLPLPSYGNTFIQSVEEYIEPFPVYRFRCWEIDDPNKMLSEIQSGSRIGWLPEPGEKLDVRLETVTQRIYNFCNEGFSYLNEVSLLSLLAKYKAQSALGTLRARIELTARYYHPAQPVPGNSPMWFLGFRDATLDDISKALSASRGWMGTVNNLNVLETNRLIAVNLGWDLDLRSFPLIQFWERAYRAEKNLLTWHPGIAEIEVLPDPLVEPTPDDEQFTEKTIDLSSTLEPLI